MFFIDTNIFIYASLDQDARKRQIANRLLEELFIDGTGVISTQILRELANTLFRKSKLPAREVRRIVLGYGRRLPCVGDSIEILDRGMEIKARHGLQFYDALVVASAEAAGCGTLYSEDMGDGRTYGSVRVANPFARESRR